MTLVFDLSNSKLAQRLLLHAMGNVHANFVFFSTLFVFQLLARMRDKQTEGRTDGQDP